jgi:hypothetical protein
LELVADFCKNIDGFNIHKNLLLNVFRGFPQALNEEVEERFDEALVLNLLRGHDLQELVDHLLDGGRFLVALVSENQLEYRKDLLQIKLILDLVQFHSGVVAEKEVDFAVELVLVLIFLRLFALKSLTDARSEG